MEQLGWKYQSRVFDLRFGSVLTETARQNVTYQINPFLFYPHLLPKFFFFALWDNDGGGGEREEGGSRLGNSPTRRNKNPPLDSIWEKSYPISRGWSFFFSWGFSQGLAMICLRSIPPFLSFSFFFLFSHGNTPKKFDMWHFWPKTKPPALLPLPNCLFTFLWWCCFYSVRFFYISRFCCFSFCCGLMTDRRWNDSRPPPKSVRRHSAEGVPDIWARRHFACWCCACFCVLVFSCTLHFSVTGAIL